MFITSSHSYWYDDDKSLREIVVVILHEKDKENVERNEYLTNLSKRNLWCMGPNFSIRNLQFQFILIS
jgi:hypothetical protein